MNARLFIYPDLDPCGGKSLRYLYGFVWLFVLFVALSSGLSGLAAAGHLPVHFPVLMDSDTYVDAEHVNESFGESDVLWASSTGGTPAKVAYLSFINDFVTNSVSSPDQIEAAKLVLNAAKVERPGKITAYFVEGPTTSEATWEGKSSYDTGASASLDVQADGEYTNYGLDMLFNCHDNLIQNNTIEDNVVAGITLISSGQNEIKGNRISENRRYGLQLQKGSDHNSIINNTISYSQSGIFVESSGNRIYANRFIENAVQAEDRDENSWNADYPKGGNLWSDYQGKDEMKGPNQDLLGTDGFGDQPYRINEISQDRYPVMGNQVKPISVLERSLSPEEARVGDSIAVKAGLKSKYALSQVSVHAYSSGVEAKGYARLTPLGNAYQGTFSTALLDPGRYEIILTARDARGYELKETLGEIELVPRGK